MLNHPDSRLVDSMDSFIPPAGEPGEFLRIERPEDLTVMDPACGSGHMLTYAFDLLARIYEEQGYPRSEIPARILTHNLFGCEIDRRAGSLAAFALTMKARAMDPRFLRREDPIQPHVTVIRPVRFDDADLEELTRDVPVREHAALTAFWNAFAQADSLGSLTQPDAAILATARTVAERIDSHTLRGDPLHQGATRVIEQAHPLSQTYTVVVTNPPYMGSGHMSDDLKKHITREFTAGRSDLYAAFILRCRELARPLGAVAMITMQSWMFLKSFSDLRASLLTNQTIDSMVHLGARGFDTIGGEVVSSIAFVLINAPAPHHQGRYLRLVEGSNEAAKRNLLAHALSTRNTDAGWFEAASSSFRQIPGEPIVYWLSEAIRSTFTKGRPLGEVAQPRVGLQTGMDARFVREWWEVDWHPDAMHCASRDEAAASGRRWFPFNKGGDFRKWYGNQEMVVNWSDDGRVIRTFGSDGGRTRSRPQNMELYFRESVSWSRISSGELAMRSYPNGFVFSDVGPSAFPATGLRPALLSLANSTSSRAILAAVAPTAHFEVGQVASLPILESVPAEVPSLVEALVSTARADWDSFETSWDFTGSALVNDGSTRTLQTRVEAFLAEWAQRSREQQARETRNNELVAELYDVVGEVPTDVPLERVSLTRNVAFTYGAGRSDREYQDLATRDLVKELISYAVGCMMGRYSLDVPGLILASQGQTFDDYLARVPDPTFRPDEDGIIPITRDERFDDDISMRFRAFLAAAFGGDHLEENLRFVEAALGTPRRPMPIAQYFRTGFFRDHLGRFNNRPIYWKFSSARKDGAGAFSALVYLHRWTPSTPSLILGEYLRTFQSKLAAEIEYLGSTGATADARKADDLRARLTECRDYERDVLYPLATRRVDVDLDDGVLVNYLRMGDAVVEVPTMEKKRAKVATWTWPHHPLEEQP
jgi:hypothetical protein